jgi:hypothetical protein
MRVSGFLHLARPVRGATLHHANLALSNHASLQSRRESSGIAPLGGTSAPKPGTICEWPAKAGVRAPHHSPRDSGWKSYVRQQTDNRGATVEASSLSMKEPLQQIGPDYYRFVQLLIAHAEFKQLDQWRVDVRKRSQIPLGMSRAPDKSRADPHRNQHFSGRITIGQPRGPRARPPHRGLLSKSKSHRYPAQDFPIKQAPPSNRDRTPSGPSAE